MRLSFLFALPCLLIAATASAADPTDTSTNFTREHRDSFALKKSAAKVKQEKATSHFDRNPATLEAHHMHTTTTVPANPSAPPAPVESSDSPAMVRH